MKYLLDTNIFRGLATGDFPAEAAKIERRLQSSGPLPFLTYEVVIDELLVKLTDGSARTFTQVQSYPSCMERICGNTHVAPAISDVMRRVLHNDPLHATDDARTKRNQLRRLILKAKGPKDLPSQLQGGI